MFQDLTTSDLFEVDGGVSVEHIAAGATFVAVGVGCMAIACIPGVNMAVAAGLVIAGAWGIAGGCTSVLYGCFAA